MSEGYEEGAYRASTAAGQQPIELASIAISMKRIADEICGIPYDSTPGADNSKHRMGLVDGVMHAIEQGLISAINSRG